MKRLISCAEASALDAETKRTAGLNSLQLMEKASLRLWDALCGEMRSRAPLRMPPHVSSMSSHAPLDMRKNFGREFPEDCRIVALCGKGDNGGDAMAMLRHARFEGGNALTAVSLDQVEGGAALAQKRSLEALGIPVLSWNTERVKCITALENAQLIIDGILGTGLKGAPRGAALEMIEACNAASVRPESPLVASIDLPSGAGDGAEADRVTVRADFTLSLEPLKAALFTPAAASIRGRLIPVSGVFPNDGRDRSAVARLIELGDISYSAGSAAPDGYKTSRGRVAVFAGSPGCTGAAKLCTRAALAAGAGYVALFADDELAGTFSAGLEEIMVRPRGSMPFDPEAWDLILVGPGWGKGPDRKKLLEELLDSGLPAILDADAVPPFGELLRSGYSPKGPVVITPHPGEFAAFSGISARAALADPESALESSGFPADLAVIFKSHMTWLRIPGEGLFVWEGLEPGLAVAGSGDVLAGLAAGLVATAFAAHANNAGQALLTAVAVHGFAGKRLRRTKGWFPAGDLIPEVARILGIPESLDPGEGQD
ncbi:MAG: NAD(P)H-hydrate dehydratase [Rectinema sp.]